DAQKRRARLAEPVRRVRHSDARREVVLVRVVDAPAPRDECREAGDGRERCVVERALDAPLRLAYGRVELVAEAEREREVGAHAPLVLREVVELVEAKV